ncbi:efflux RND transporter periplasmic adaptor subunit [Novispirillum sp. DQ9]|uniref:efflux RND transporter periplasmic adaptor subunit n=1 Tax=Novispirillum sp. DQ9 TaxID=3398612 RepID=UPI003C7B1235
MSPKALVLAAVALVAGVGGGIAYERFAAPTVAATGAAGEKKILYWVAPMDPNYRRDAPGKSPMGMDLIPVYEGEEPGAGAGAAQADPPGVVRLSPAVINSIGVRTGTVERTAFGDDVRTVGYVAMDEDRTSHVHVRKEGWIEGLRVRSVGAEVQRGDLLFEFFSPELAVASWEYVREIERGSAGMTGGARAKLKALGLADRQIEEIRTSRQPAERIRVYAPQRGVLVQLGVGEGMYIRPDQTLMTFSDLSSVWVIADVFESDGARVAAGMQAEARLDHLPGEVWRGTVDYVYPELDPVTRTLRVRLRFANPGLALRPNMFAAITLKTTPRQDVLVVPSEAVIRTGRSDRVVLAQGDGRFKPVAVTVGGQWNGLTEIIDGVEAGDAIVLSGQFLIDSESSLTSGLARMDPHAGHGHGHGHGAPAPARAPAPASAPEVVAETAATINAVDLSKRTLNVTHGPIPALGWPPMTMDFAAGEGIDLAALPAGAAVVLGIGRDAAGTFIAVRVTPKAEATQ